MNIGWQVQHIGLARWRTNSLLQSNTDTYRNTPLERNRRMCPRQTMKILSSECQQNNTHTTARPPEHTAILPKEQLYAIISHTWHVTVVMSGLKINSPHRRWTLELEWNAQEFCRDRKREIPLWLRYADFIDNAVRWTRDDGVNLTPRRIKAHRVCLRITVIIKMSIIMKFSSRFAILSIYISNYCRVK